MKRHKWRKGGLPQLCENCGIIRSRETRKYLMAITNKPPYNHYKYKTVMIYQTPDKKYDKAPDCHKINLLKQAHVKRNAPKQ